MKLSTLSLSLSKRLFRGFLLLRASLTSHSRIGDFPIQDFMTVVGVVFRGGPFNHFGINSYNLIENKRLYPSLDTYKKQGEGALPHQTVILTMAFRFPNGVRTDLRFARPASRTIGSRPV
jgi:hypothetical protein